VPRITRTAAVVWNGSVARGSGSISAGTGAFVDLPYSLPTRIGDAEGKTSPEELLAAAHAGCFAMSLASELTERGSPPDRLEVACEILMDEVEDRGHQIVASSLLVSTSAAVGEDALAAAVQEAEQGCPFSSLLQRAGVRLAIETELTGG
jgi:osmotically inducible protein OsmC